MQTFFVCAPKNIVNNSHSKKAQKHLHNNCKDNDIIEDTDKIQLVFILCLFIEHW